MESIKNRTLLVEKMVCEGCEEKIKKEISNLSGVLEVEANHKTEKVKVKYDILKINLKSIEYKLKKIGYNLRENFLYKLDRGFIHFLEKNEKDNLTGKSSACCSNPEEILNKNQIKLKS